jgi:hypothetical protein
MAQVGGLTLVLYISIRICVQSSTELKILYQTSFFLYRKNTEEFDAKYDLDEEHTRDPNAKSDKK